MKIIYRISDIGYNKLKPQYINNENCLNNALLIFPQAKHDWHIIADNISNETNNMIQKYISKNYIEYVNIGHGAGTFNLALNKALTFNDDDIIYFLENDYLHCRNSDNIIQEGFDIGADYITLYDHPDKYLSGIDGGNPYVENGGEMTRVLISTSTHWKLTNSTTMTFASMVKVLRESESILRKWTCGTHPNDFNMFIELRERGYSLISPIPGYSTHGEISWLAPFIDWKSISLNSK